MYKNCDNGFSRTNQSLETCHLLIKFAKQIAPINRFTVYPGKSKCFFLDYQEAFFTPGILPSKAISRKVTREIPNWRIYPLGRPVNLQRLCKRTGEAFFGNLSNAA